MKLSRSNALLFVLDVQEKIFSVMHEQEKTKRNICRAIEGADVLEIPVIWTEQYPAGLGPTLPDVAAKMNGQQPLQKMSFSCLGDEQIREQLKEHDRNQILVCGIETHVCVYQTVQDLLTDGFEVHVITDCVMSRHEPNHKLGLQKMADMGAQRTSVEMALFELLGLAEGEQFKAVARIIK